jgi:hypothetical protein
MCRSGSEKAASDLEWHLDEDGDSWRLTVPFARKPVVDLSPEALRLEEEDAFVLPVPLRAQPVNLDSAHCSFSGKRRELIVKWPRASSKSSSAAPPESENATTTPRHGIFFPRRTRIMLTQGVNHFKLRLRLPQTKQWRQNRLRPRRRSG